MRHCDRNRTESMYTVSSFWWVSNGARGRIELMEVERRYGSDKMESIYTVSTFRGVPKAVRRSAEP